MGTFSSSLYGSDLAMDLKAEFFELYNNGDEADKLKKHFIKDFNKLDDEEKFVTLYVMADCFWQIGSLDDELLQQVKTAFESGEEEELLKDLDANKSFISKRKANILKLIEKISVPKPKPKKRVSPPVIIECDYNNGSVLSYFDGEKYGVLIVMASTFYDKKTYYSFLKTNVKTTSKPTMEDVLSSRIYDNIFHNKENYTSTIPQTYYEFRPTIGSYLPANATKKFHKYNKEFFEVIGCLSNWDYKEHSTSWKILEYKEKTYDEFYINACNILNQDLGDNLLTKETVAEIEAEFTSTDIDFLIKKYAFCRFTIKVMELLDIKYANAEGEDLLEYKEQYIEYATTEYDQYGYDKNGKDYGYDYQIECYLKAIPFIEENSTNENENEVKYRIERVRHEIYMLERYSKIKKS